MTDIVADATRGDRAGYDEKAPGAIRPASSGLFWKQEDWWVVAAGLGIIAVAYALFVNGSSLSWLAVTPAKWTTFDQITAHFAANWVRYAAQFAFWLVLITGILAALGHAPRNTIPAFIFLYVVSVIIFTLGQWAEAVKYNLEPPLVALAAGLLLANFNILPRSLDAGFRVEFYIKLGVVLLGATLPFTLIVWAGPTAILQASIVSIVTFLVIFYAARSLKIDPRFAATLGVGGAVCGVSAAIAIAAAVGARKRDSAVVISIVIVWAIVMIFVLPFASHALNLSAGVGGAWIGTSEFADAAGIAAAQAYGDIVSKAPGGAANATDQAVSAFTLMKVVGRDTWIGIWAIVLSIIAATRWENTGIVNRASPLEIWRRFPKFIIGFLLASLFISLVAQGAGHDQFTKVDAANLVAPVKNLRTWAFAFGFLSIGLTTRFRDLAGVGLRPVLAFSSGVLVNVVLGFILSAYVFGAYWTSLGH